MTVYCNITECKNWLPLKEIHHMDNKPGFSPIGKTNEYTGQCAFKNIEIIHLRMAYSNSMDQIGRFGVAKIFHLFSLINKALIIPLILIPV